MSQVLPTYWVTPKRRSEKTYTNNETTMIATNTIAAIRPTGEMELEDLGLVGSSDFTTQ